MFKRIRAAITVALLVGTASLTSLAAPAPTFAANPSDPDGDAYTGNLAGRPINGYSYDAAGTPRFYNTNTNTYVYGLGTGHGIAYARVNDQIVLLYPYHGRKSREYDGKYVYGPNDSKIGYFQTLFSPISPYPGIVCDGVLPNGTANCIQDHDLAYIVLYQGNWPASLNQVYRGSGNSPVYWTITDDTGEGLTCDEIPDFTFTLYHNFQKDPSTYWSYRSGSTDGIYTWPGGSSPSNPAACTVKTTLVWHNYPGGTLNSDGTCNACPYRDSGSPWIALYNTNTVFGITSGATGVVGSPNVYIFVTPLYEGMKVLYHYWQFWGSNAFLCKTATC